MKATWIRPGLLMILGAASANAQSTPLIPSHTPTVPAKAAAVSPAAVVVRINGAALTERDLQREMRKLFPYSGVHGGRIPGEYATELRQQAKNQLVFDELLYQEALRRKMTVPLPPLPTSWSRRGSALLPSRNFRSTRCANTARCKASKRRSVARC